MPEMAKICVIGGTGFVGSHVVSTALAKGWKVNATTRDASIADRVAFLKKLPNAEGKLTLFSGELGTKGSFDDATKECDGVVICALPERPSEPALIELVRGGVEHILAGCARNKVKSVVITSSGGSTNPKEGEPEIKNELEHWSDPEFQISKGKFSPAAKTLMEKAALKFAEENPSIKVAIMNPNLIAGPTLNSEVPSFLEKLVKGQLMQQIPNSSMSIIDVRDLALMEIAALENPDIKGRYFCVLKSFHWKDILEALKQVYPEFQIPKLGYEGSDIRPTQFDFTRRDTLGVKLRDLNEVMGGVVKDLKDKERL